MKGLSQLGLVTASILLAILISIPQVAEAWRVPAPTCSGDLEFHWETFNDEIVVTLSNLCAWNAHTVPNSPYVEIINGNSYLFAIAYRGFDGTPLGEHPIQLEVVQYTVTIHDQVPQGAFVTNVTIIVPAGKSWLNTSTLTSLIYAGVRVFPAGAVVNSLGTVPVGGIRIRPL
ncbi:MAG: hypothetical protein HY459_01210 [Parcubacteria group bacterium]|nr:hypothetical protein [Parcubacteria group bacterium]